MKAMLNPYDVSDEDVGLGGAAIEDLFKAEYDLPCRPHPNVVRVLHHFCASVPPRGLIVSLCMVSYDQCFMLLGLPQWPPYGGRSSLFLVMKEYDCNLQSHCRNMRQRGSLDEQFLLTVLLQLFKAIEHLVRHNILHRDLKLDNVLLKLEPNMTRSACWLFVIVTATVLLSYLTGLSYVTLDAAMSLLSLLLERMLGDFVTLQLAIQPITLLSSPLSQLTPTLYAM